ncbi:phage minor head protein [Streptomyces sp. NPDC087422]|uniref:phage minor head protein n=1 Tax=Streptomyces sp. NPDC087422 TaxID=3365786 RepID=UPI0037FCE3A6
MARWRDFFRRSNPDVTKAVSPATTPAATFTAAQVASVANAAARGGQQVTGMAVPLPRTDPQVAFGPGVPLFPAAIDPPRPDTGRPEPRFNEYPVTSNLPGVSDRLVPWKVLRDAADAGGLPRRCIEIRKAEVTTLDWAVTITKQAVEAEQHHTDKPRSEVEGALRERLSGDIARCTRFWEQPDPGQGESFAEWLGKLLEEQLVLDAVAIYPRLTYGGDLYALEILDGSTIKVLRDHRGGRPAPPDPAFQQLLWGFPRGEFIADTDADGTVLAGYASDRLVYKRRNVRAHTPYGYSAVEQALEDVDVWLRRRKWIRDEYTEGTLPTGWITSNGQSQWTPQQVREYETDLNDTYSGGTAARHRLRVLPPGMDLETQGDVAERYKPEYDLFLVKQIAAHFDVTIAELGFTETGGLGSTGWHEGQADVQQRKATLPTLRWLQQLLTDVSRKHLGMPAELEFRFLGLEEEDAAAADAVAGARLKDGRITRNEDRDRMGMPRFDFPEADMPMVQTGRGLVFLNGAAKLAPPGEVVGPVLGPPQADADADGVLDAPHGPDTDVRKPGASGESNGPAGDDGDREEAVKAELAAYRRWARKNPHPARNFAFTTVTKADAPHIPHTAVTFAEAGDTGPKVPDLHSARQWPGWGPDQTAVTYWTPVIRSAMRAAADTRRIAEMWLAERLVTKTDEPDPDTATSLNSDADTAITPQHDAAGWLTARGITLIEALVIIRDLRSEGYVIGERSAQAVLTAHATLDWSNWKPGDPTAARLTRTPEALRALLDEAGITIRSVAATRLGKLAEALSDALAKGSSADSLARELRGILDDPAWAERVAVTEIARGVSAATVATYQANGIAEASWLTAVDQRVCEKCLDNEGTGPLPVGSAFPSGVRYPPAHPSCRCTLYPETGTT